MSADEEVTCRDFAELVTAYLEERLDDEVRADVEEHLGGCPGCQNLLAQWRTVVDLAGRLAEEDVEATDEITRDRLLSLFRTLRRR